MYSAEVQEYVAATRRTVRNNWLPPSFPLSGGTPGAGQAREAVPPTGGTWLGLAQAAPSAPTARVKALLPKSSAARRTAARGRCRGSCQAPPPHSGTARRWLPGGAHGPTQPRGPQTAPPGPPAAASQGRRTDPLPRAGTAPANPRCHFGVAQARPSRLHQDTLSHPPPAGSRPPPATAAREGPHTHTRRGLHLPGSARSPYRSPPAGRPARPPRRGPALPVSSSRRPARQRPRPPGSGGR